MTPSIGTDTIADALGKLLSRGEPKYSVGLNVEENPGKMQPRPARWTWPSVDVSRSSAAGEVFPSEAIGCFFTAEIGPPPPPLSRHVRRPR